jgi:hypothetical protein
MMALLAEPRLTEQPLRTFVARLLVSTIRDVVGSPRSGSRVPGDPPSLATGVGQIR